MATFPSRAKVVIIGAGIVGNSVAYHLANLGWRDLLLIDKGPLPNPGGSTGHASNFIFLVDHNKEMTQLTVESADQYKAWDVYTTCGGIEVARTETRMNELRRRMDSAKNWGIDDARLVTPAEIAALVPFVDASILVGGFYTPGVGVVDSLRFGTLCREKAEAMGALSVFGTTEVTGIGIEDERVTNVQTSRGTVEAEYVVIACGVWSPRVAEMAGSHIPLTPTVHQMADYGPVPLFERSTKAIEYPIVRDMDVLMYERQDGVGIEVGSYAHRSILHDPEDIPSNEAAPLSPTEFPFTQEDFDPQLEDALALMPSILGDERVGQKYAINGLIALTPDGMPLLGETSEVKGLWSAAAVWVKEGTAA
ncbi:MAG TPA: FAD-binding oxidoreductase, partial [Candidatus Binatus sp.]|nr:FAD-binding oxidoreductase [Candidatus Binatus sp.]